MKRLKRFYFILICIMACSMMSCSDDNPDGVGTNPKLNIENYIFGPEGGVIDVYSTINYPIQVYPTEESGLNIERITVDGYPPEAKIYGTVGDWYRIYEPIPSLEQEKLPYKLGAGIRIEVKPNQTGEERTIPIGIMSGDYGCRVSYKQSK